MHRNYRQNAAPLSNVYRSVTKTPRNDTRVPNLREKELNNVSGCVTLALPVTSNGLKTNSMGELLNTSAFEPIAKVFALTDIECLKLMASVYNGFDSNASDSNAPSDR